MLHLLLITALPVASQIIADIPTFRKNTSGFRSLVLSVNSCECIFFKDLFICLFQVVHTHKPHFMALHCQEFGGKNYEASMSHVDKFVK